MRLLMMTAMMAAMMIIFFVDWTMLTCSLMGSAIAGVVGPFGWRFFLIVFINFLDAIVDQLPVLLKIEFLIVTDWRVDDFGGIVLFFWIMEFRKIRMLEDFVGSGSFIRIKLKHSANEIDGIWRGIRFEPILDIFHSELVDRADHRHRYFWVQRRNIFFRRISSKRNNPFELVEGWVSWKHGFSDENFSQDTSNAPNVDWFLVVLGPKKNFRSSVPSRGYFFRQNYIWPLSVVDQAPS